MTKITGGKISGHASADYQLHTRLNSTMELELGDVTENGALRVAVFEENEEALRAAIEKIRSAVDTLQSHGSSDMKREAMQIADTASKILHERRWYSISLDGLLEAAKAVGTAASPVLSLVLKTVEIVQKLKP